METIRAWANSVINSTDDDHNEVATTRKKSPEKIIFSEEWGKVVTTYAEKYVITSLFIRSDPFYHVIKSTGPSVSSPCGQIFVRQGTERYY